VYARGNVRTVADVMMRGALRRVVHGAVELDARVACTIENAGSRPLEPELDLLLSTTVLL
jgi:hypothetical protein